MHITRLGAKVRFWLGGSRSSLEFFNISGFSFFCRTSHVQVIQKNVIGRQAEQLRRMKATENLRVPSYRNTEQQHRIFVRVVFYFASRSHSLITVPSFRSLSQLLLTSWSKHVQDVMSSIQKHHMVVQHDRKLREREKNRSFWGMTPRHATTTMMKPLNSTASLPGHRDQEGRPEDGFERRSTWGLRQVLRHE